MHKRFSRNSDGKYVTHSLLFFFSPRLRSSFSWLWARRENYSREHHRTLLFKMRTQHFSPYERDKKKERKRGDIFPREFSHIESRVIGAFCRSDFAIGMRSLILNRNEEMTRFANNYAPDLLWTEKKEKRERGQGGIERTAETAKCSYYRRGSDIHRCDTMTDY